MKLSLCSCGYLLILGLFAIIKTGVGWRLCYENQACEDKAEKAVRATDPRVIRQAWSEYVSCLKKAPRKIGETVCDEEPYYCLRMTAKLGGDQIEMMDCAIGPENCDILKKMMPQNVKDFHCETCEMALCNHAPNDPEYFDQFQLRDKGSKVKQNTSNSRNSSSCVYLSVFGFALMLGAFFL